MGEWGEAWGLWGEAWGLSTTVFVGGIFVGMLGLFVLGRRFGHRHRAAQGAVDGIGIVNTAVFSLLGLLIAFTFSGAAGRYDERRKLIIAESNAIDVAYLRVDVLPEAMQPPIRDEFRRYVDSRIAFYDALPRRAVAGPILAESEALQSSLWKQVVAGCRESPSPATMSVVLPAMNTMIDLTTTRRAALTFHQPLIIYLMLAALALASALLVGFDMGGVDRMSTLHAVGFATLVTFIILVIFDLEYPRRGLVSLLATDEFLVAVRRQMN